MVPLGSGQFSPESWTSPLTIKGKYYDQHVSTTVNFNPKVLDCTRFKQNFNYDLPFSFHQ